MKNYFAKFRTEKNAVLIFFMLLFALGCVVFKDYGMSFDETYERKTGLVNAKYIGSLFSDSVGKKLDPNNKIKNIREYKDRYYGAILELPLVIVEPLIAKVFSKPAIWKFRHFMTFGFFFIGVVLFYKFISQFFKSKTLGILSALVIFLTPRFFAESFYNIKDIAFFATYLFSFYYYYRFLIQRTNKSARLLGLFAALSSAVRILGVLFVFFAGCVILAEIIQKRDTLKKNIVLLISLGLSFAFFLILFYPASWYNPPVYFYEVIRQMGQFPWDGAILYFGKVILAHEIPWHYVPVWISITTPLPILAFIIFGFFITIKHVIADIRIRKVTNDTYIYMAVLFVFIFPLTLMIAGSSTLYDGWRHLYFTYSAMVFFVVVGVRSFYMFFIRGKNVLRNIGYAILAICILHSGFTAFWMIKNHPHQNVYFNCLAGKNPSLYFERDYWGLAMKKGLEYVLANDPRSSISILDDGPVTKAADMINTNDSKRFTFTENPALADYHIFYYRSTPKQEFEKGEVYFLKVDNFKIMSVLKLR